MPILSRLRGLHRGYKFALVLIAAWAPLAFPERPLLAGVLMALTTALFLTATGSKSPLPDDERTKVRENSDAES
jgi:hypothetical protein